MAPEQGLLSLLPHVLGRRELKGNVLLSAANKVKIKSEKVKHEGKICTPTPTKLRD
jgi:hypothetical protein